MTFSSFITALFSQVIKPFVAALVSTVMALSAAVSGPAQGYKYLSMKPILNSCVHTHVEYEVSADAGAIAEMTGITVQEVKETLAGYGIDGIADERDRINISNYFDLYTDIEKIRLALRLGAEGGRDYAVYVDSGAAAVSEDLTGDLIGVLDSDYPDAYKKYYDGFGLYFNFNEYFGNDFIDAESSEKLMDNLGKILESVSIAEKEEAEDSDELTAIVKLLKPVKSLGDKFYTEGKTDGVKSYSFRMDGRELAGLIEDILEIMSTEEFFSAYIDYLGAAADNTDYSALGTVYGMNEQEIAEFKAQMELLAQQSVTEQAQNFAEVLTAIKPYLKMLSTGDNTEELLGSYAQTFNEKILPYVQNSYVESTIFEKDGKIAESFEFAVTDGRTPIFTVSYESSASEYTGEIPSPAAAVPFEKRVTTELLDNKVGFENAAAKGVGSIEIEWESSMKPTDTEAVLKSPFLFVNYKTKMLDMIEKAPELSEEQKAELKQYYTEQDYEYSAVSSSAHLIEDRVYLPLRQLMENAGYAVSWDDAERKAYVTVGDEKIEMTGTIINDKTYVKVRDFEKLGAVVEYEETVYYAENWNNFSKTCYATITFAK